MKSTPMSSRSALWTLAATVLISAVRGQAGDSLVVDQGYGYLLQSDLPGPIAIASPLINPLIRVPRDLDTESQAVSVAEERSDSDDTVSTVTSILPDIIGTFSSPTPTPTTYSSTVGSDRSGFGGSYIGRPSKLIVTVKTKRRKYGHGKGKGGGYGGHGGGGYSSFGHGGLQDYGHSEISYGHDIGTGYSDGSKGKGYSKGGLFSGKGYGKGSLFGGKGYSKGGYSGGKGFSKGGYSSGKGHGKGGHGGGYSDYSSFSSSYGHDDYSSGHGKGETKAKGYTGYGAKRIKQIKNLFKSVYDDIKSLKKSDLEYLKSAKAEKGKGEEYQEYVITPVYDHGYGEIGAADGYGHDHGFGHGHGFGGFDDHFGGHGGFGDFGGFDSFHHGGGGYRKGKFKSHGGFSHGHFGGDSYDRISFKNAPYKGPKLGPYDFFPDHKGYLTKSGKIGNDPVKEKKHSYEKTLAHFGGFGGGGNRYGPGLKGYTYLIDHIDGPKPHHGYGHKDAVFTQHKFKSKGHGGGYGHGGGLGGLGGGGYGHHGGGFDHHGGGYGHHDTGYGKGKDKGYTSFFKGLFSGGKGKGYGGHDKGKGHGGYDTHGIGHGGGYDSHGKGHGKGFNLFKGKGHGGGGYSDHGSHHGGGYSDHGKGKGGFFSKGKGHGGGGGYGNYDSFHHGGGYGGHGKGKGGFFSKGKGHGGGYDDHHLSYGHRRVAQEHQGQYSHSASALTSSPGSAVPGKVLDSSKIDYSVSFHDAKHKIPVYVPQQS